MMLSLLEKQFIFTQLISRLILAAKELDSYLTYGEAYRTPEQAKLNAQKGTGISNSLHTKRLAIDLNLFIKGVYQTDSKAYKSIGELWESYSTKDYKCCWGGRFKRPDGNHFSIEHEGVR